VPGDEAAVLCAVNAGLADSAAGRICYSPLDLVIGSQLAWDADVAKIREKPGGLLLESRSLIESGVDRKIEKRRSPLPPISKLHAPMTTPKRPPPWFVGMSSAFAKQVSCIDRTLQGRILEALTDLAKNPLEMRGDTVKPLSGDFKGCWRYRIGPYRLIYSPDSNTGDITLLAFAARGGAYD